MGLLRAWTNHRSRQAGRYAKRIHKMYVRTSQVPSAGYLRRQAARELRVRVGPLPYPPAHSPVRRRAAADAALVTWRSYWFDQGRRYVLGREHISPRDDAERLAFERGVDETITRLGAEKLHAEGLA